MLERLTTFDLGCLDGAIALRATFALDPDEPASILARFEQMLRRRNETQPYKSQRFVDKFGEDPAYGWSEDKARQYSVPERADFGAFVRSKGFNLD